MRQNNMQVLRVKADFMGECRLREGDYVIVQRCDAVKEGEMVLALLRNEELTLGRVHHDGHRVRFEGANPAEEATILDEADVTILGVFVGILRKYTG